MKDAKDKRSVRLSGRITPVLKKEIDKLRPKFPKWTESDFIEEGLRRLVADLNPATDH